MIKGTKERLEELIVLTFATKPHLTAAELQSEIANRGKAFTIQAIYQELRKLQQERVVTKVRDRYMLRVAWVLEMAALTDTIYNSYVTRSPLAEISPEVGERASWQIPSVSRLVTFWAQMNLALCAEAKAKQLFEYLPHIWFHLAATADEEQFLTGLDIAGIKYYGAVGGESYLDRLYLKTPRKGIEMRFGQCPFTNGQDIYQGVIGDFLLTIKLHKTVVADIEHLYSNVKRPEDLEPGTLAEIFNRPCSCKMQVERGTAKAKRVRKNFIDFFGVIEGR